MIGVMGEGCPFLYTYTISELKQKRWTSKHNIQNFGDFEKQRKLTHYNYQLGPEWHKE